MSKASPIDAKDEKLQTHLNIKPSKSAKGIKTFKADRSVIYWSQDPVGYFLIKTHSKTKLISLAFCRNDNKIIEAITGTEPTPIYFKAVERGLLSRLDHACYLGRELMRAYDALRNGTEYVQDGMTGEQL